MPGMQGPPGPPPDTEEVDLALKTTKGYIGKILNISKIIGEHQTTVERVIENQLTIVNNSHTEVLRLLGEKKSVIIREATTLTNITCTKCSAKLKTKDKDICCDDCQKPKFKVPSKPECDATGCSYGCAYSNSTCDSAGKKQPPCMIPFKYLGVEHHSCIMHSPFGLTRRPWCYVNSEANRGAPPSDWAFCDCTAVTCICPKGQKLRSDGKTCTSAL
jgi:Zn finger protein HypA/HybF involved in hydrogenase expression